MLLYLVNFLELGALTIPGTHRLYVVGENKSGILKISGKYSKN
jgi:hypothetical protein